MIRGIENPLPAGWTAARIGEIAEVNPSFDGSSDGDNPAVSFVPMAAVEAETGVIEIGRTRRLDDVRKGYRPFRERDVLFAKITPCMENGKMAVVPRLKHGLGFGSTEFHVLRPHREISPDYLYRLVSAVQFRRDAERHMTGAVGQRRVPTSYLADQTVPLPPTAEQRRIVAKIEELLSELDNGVAMLKTARQQLGTYRQAVLKHAFEGKLTSQWRERNKDNLETHAQMLARINDLRAERYDQDLRNWKEAVGLWETAAKVGTKPARPKRPPKILPISVQQRKDLPAIPDCWEWISLKAVGRIETGTTPSTRNPANYDGTLPFFKPTDLDQGMHVRSARDHLSRLGEESARILPPDSTLVTCIGATIGKTGLAATRCATNQQINSISPYIGVAARLVYFQVSAPFLNDRIKADASATTLPILNKSKFEELPFALCPIPEQDELVRLVEDRDAEIERREREIEVALRKLETLRQSILKEAFSGQLVPQDLSDEPASGLLDRIRTEREQAKTRKTRPNTGKRKNRVTR